MSVALHIQITDVAQVNHQYENYCNYVSHYLMAKLLPIFIIENIILIYSAVASKCKIKTMFRSITA